MKSFYSNPQNLYDVLKHYVAIFSEGRDPIVPFIRTINGGVDVKKTLELNTYSGFPATEKEQWLSYVNG